MSEEYMRVGPLRSPDSLREIEPITPYPRIDSRQRKSEDQRRDDRQRDRDGKSRPRRRFTAMRRLVGRMKGSARFRRIDYATADRELRGAGLKIAEEELIALLLQLKFSLSSIDNLFRDLRENPPHTALRTGRLLAADNRQILPEPPEGLSEYNLVLQELKLRPNRQNSQLNESLENAGRFSYERDRLRLSFQRSDSPRSDSLALTVSILVGAVEIDAGGRRVIVYQRPDQSYGLYADKQIDLSI